MTLNLLCIDEDIAFSSLYIDKEGERYPIHLRERDREDTLLNFPLPFANTYYV